MSKKYYAVKKGRTPGVYTTWTDAQKQISGYSNAQFKSFQSKDEAEAFIDDSNVQVPPVDDQMLIAYVDGSFDKHSARYSYGVVLAEGSKVIDELSNAADDPTYAESFQIAGECFGALNAIKWAIDHQYKSIAIYYDYLGIEMWATGQWKANKKVSQDYVAYFKQFSNKIDIQFVKVKAHSGVLYNERADELAKRALNA